MFLLWIIEENDPRGGVLARFYRPGGGGFELFFSREVGNSHIKKIAQREWSGLELTDTLHVFCSLAFTIG